MIGLLVRAGWLVLLALVVATPAGATAKDLRKLLGEGAAALQREDYPAARRAYESATRTDMGSIAAWRGLGWAHWELGDEARAVEIWRRALRVRPDDTGLLFALAIAAEEHRLYDEALTKYGRVIGAEPGHRRARMGRARLLIAQRRHREAEKDLAVAIAKDPNDFEAPYALAHVYAETGRPDESRRALERLAKRSPRSRDAVLGIARAHAQFHRDGEAIAVLERFLEEHPSDAKIHQEIARIAGDAGHDEKAIAHLKILVAERPRETKWQLRLARAYERSGELDESAKIAEAIVKADGKNVEAMSVLYERARAANREDEAGEWMRRIVEAEPSARRWKELGDLSLVRGVLLDESGESAEARDVRALAAEAYRRATQLDPLDADARLGVATALRLSGDSEAAIRVAEGVLRDHPNVERARRELYEANAKLGRYDEASRQLRASLAVFPRNPRLEHELARSAFRAGEREQAIDMLQGLLDEPLRPGVPVLLYHGVSPATTNEGTMPLANFRDQMRTLAKLGYQPITAQEVIAFLDGSGTLPPKPVFVTFDDARADALESADPVLREIGFRATMFVPTGEIGEHGELNATWDHLRALKQSGRWDMQCHGHLGHRQIAIDDQGATGHFLVNRMWLEEKKRLETAAEYRQRVQEDYRRCREILEREVPGTEFAAYAFPFGEVGHKGFGNERSAVEVNKRLAVELFGVGFVQDPFGYVTRRSSRAVLPRFEVPREFTGRQLAEHLRQTEPFVATAMVLGDLYSSDGRFEEADAIFDRLAKEEGVDRGELLARRGRVHRSQWAIHDGTSASGGFF